MKNSIFVITALALTVIALLVISRYAYDNTIKGMCEEHIENYQQYPDYFVTEIDRNECQSYGYEIPQV